MTTTPDFRALCAELVELLESEWFGVSYQPKALDRARAALATPPPVATKPPTVMEIIELSTEFDDAGLGIVDFTRAALERWGQ